ncbi:hypothetical protein WMY93_012090 [Mugilogobius chulae]|uniref:Uncharacterized protein n=1 Tax=Mugilogobius chulae TaxID=88201 RepID=A0AAW0PDA4_9GOBI
MECKRVEPSCADKNGKALKDSIDIVCVRIRNRECFYYSGFTSCSVAPPPHTRHICSLSALTVGEMMEMMMALTTDEPIQLHVTTGKNGTTKIVWKNVPQHHLKDGAVVMLFRHHMDQQPRAFLKLQSSEGSRDIPVPLHEGLQARLHKAGWPGMWMEEELCRGIFQSPDPVPIYRYSGKLQLTVENGKACFKLFLWEGSHRLKNEFYYSWVGLYKSNRDDNKNYLTNQWQWAIHFKPCGNLNDYDTYSYCTDTTITSGLQARFMISDYNEKARTPEWS